MIKRSEFKQEFVHKVKSKIEFLIENKFWTNTTFDNYQVWLNQFNDVDEKYFACTLLNTFINYNEEDIRGLCKYGIYNKILNIDTLNIDIENEFCIENAELSLKIEEIIKKIAFVPLKAKASPAQSSTAFISRLLQQTIKSISDIQIIDINVVNLDFIDKYEHILIVDDVIGSSEQYYGFFMESRYLYKGESYSLNEIAAKMPNKRFEYFCLAATAEGIDKIINSENYRNNIFITPCEIYDDTFKVFSDKSIFFESIEEKNSCYEIYKIICERANLNCFGYKGLDYAFGFHHRIPDFCLPLFYEQTTKWRPLF